MLIRLPTPETMIYQTSLMPTISVALSIVSTFRDSYKVNDYSSFIEEEVQTQSFATDKVLDMELELLKF